MTADVKLDELEALLAKATPGPWKADGLVIEGPRGPETDHDPMVIAGLKGGKGLTASTYYSLYSIPGRKEGDANAALIVSLVNSAPSLIAAARRAERMEEALKQAAKTFRHYEKLHLYKDTAEGRAKADTNGRFAAECEAALEPKP